MCFDADFSDWWTKQNLFIKLDFKTGTYPGSGSVIFVDPETSCWSESGSYNWWTFNWSFVAYMTIVLLWGFAHLCESKILKTNVIYCELCKNLLNLASLQQKCY